MRLFVVLASSFAAAGHGVSFPINEALGVPGFPDCVRRNPTAKLSVEEAANDLECFQKQAPKGAVRIACVGDSITAGVCSSGGEHPYPQQLQLLLDSKYGSGAYSVTNLGACGSTMLKVSNSPYWERPQFDALNKGRWDVVTIMLGTNDAKDPGDNGPNNWLHNCGGVDHTSLSNCSYAADYAAFIKQVRALGTTPGVSPKIYTLVPPPLMELDAIGANQTVINSVFPRLVPMISKANQADGVVDVFGGMGGESNWQTDPAWPSKCDLNSPWEPCAYWCDEQSCDQCHPNDSGYAHLSQVLLSGLGL